MDDASRPPIDRMFEIVNGYGTARAVYAGTALGLPDLLAGRPRTAAELAVCQAVYDLGPYRTIVDVGGGEGAFLSSIPAAHGVVLTCRPP